MSELILSNERIKVAFDTARGVIISVTDLKLGAEYPISDSGFSLTSFGREFFKNPTVKTAQKCANTVKFTFSDDEFKAEVSYRIPDEGAFVEKEVSFVNPARDWRAEFVTAEDIKFGAKPSEIHFHDDQTLWHVPTNFFVRYEKGGLYLGLEYPFWDICESGDDSVKLGYEPQYAVKAEEKFTLEKFFLGVYENEGVYRYSHGPYPGKYKMKYLDVFKWVGLDQHFVGNVIPEDVGMPEEILDYGEVWAMQDFFADYLPKEPLPEEGYWIWQNGWWAGLTAPDTSCLPPIINAGIKDVMTAGMYYGHDSHPVTEPKYVRDVRTDPLGFPKLREEDAEGSQHTASGWHEEVHIEHSDTPIEEYTENFEAPGSFDKFIRDAADMGIYISSFSTPNNAYTEHPEWLGLNKEGKAYEYFGTKLSCPASKEYMEFHYKVLKKAIDRYYQRFWAFDGRWMSFCELAGYHFGHIGEEPCYAENHGHLPGNSRYAEWKNIEEFKKRIREDYPTMCLEQYYGLKRGGIWSLKAFNSDENYYEMGSIENNRYQTWHNENSRFRPMYLNYASVFGETAEEFLLSFISCLSTSSYCQLSRGYEALKNYPECAEELKKWRKWANDNYKFLIRRRSIFGIPGEYAADGSVHAVGSEGYIFIFTAPGKAVDARIPFTRLIGLDEKPGTHYEISLVTSVKPDTECSVENPVLAYGDVLRLRLTPSAAVILRIEPTDKATVKNDVAFGDGDIAVEAFPAPPAI